MPATVDFLFTPLPTRWKLCSFDRSRTTIEYVPALTPWCRTAPPALRSEIVFFGPTVASSFGVGAAGGRLRRRRHRRRVADRELLEHLRRVRVALDRVAALAERDRPGDGAGRLDLRELLDAGAEEAEVVLVGEVAHRDLVRARIELGDQPAVGVRERDGEAGPDDAVEVDGLHRGGRRTLDEHERRAASETKKPGRRIVTVYAFATGTDWRRRAIRRRTARRARRRSARAASPRPRRRGCGPATGTPPPMRPTSSLRRPARRGRRRRPAARGAPVRQPRVPLQPARRPATASSTTKAKSCLSGGNVITSS